MDHGKRLVINTIVCNEGGEEIGMPDLIRCIYLMQHHQSARVYEKAIFLSSRYFVGDLGAGLAGPFNLTDIVSDMCQFYMVQPEIDQVVAQTASYQS